MRRERLTGERIAFASRQAEAGTPIKEVRRETGVSEPSLQRWKKRFASMGVPEVRRLRQPEEENGRLKQLVADLTLDKSMLQNVLKRKW